MVGGKGINEGRERWGNGGLVGRVMDEWDMGEMG